MILKKIIAASAALFLLSPLPTQAGEAEDFTYTIINGETTITGFTGKPSYIEIPSEVEGFPVTQIRDNAFYKCSSLKQISLPSTIEKIGHHTFYACTSLESIVLPSSLAEIGMGAFSGCSKLSAVTLPDTLTELPEDCFQACISLTEAIIPDETAIIGADCFNGCTALTYIQLEEGIQQIGDRAFYMCSSLKSLYIPLSVEHIGYEAAGFDPAAGSSAVMSSFTVLGKNNSAAEQYAVKNGLSFSPASGPVREFNPEPSDIKKVPHWVILALSAGGIGFFALSCIIAVRQHRHERKLNFSDDNH